jgi:hypothetical protein
MFQSPLLKRDEIEPPQLYLILDFSSESVDKKEEIEKLCCCDFQIGAEWGEKEGNFRAQRNTERMSSLSQETTTLAHRRPALTEDDVRLLLLSQYNVTVDVTKPLDSERDQNFYVKDKGGLEFVLKISNVEENLGSFKKKAKLICCEFQSFYGC